MFFLGLGILLLLLGAGAGRKNTGVGCLLLMAALMMAAFALGDGVVTAVHVRQSADGSQRGAQAATAGSPAPSRWRRARDAREHKSAETVRQPPQHPEVRGN